MAYANLCMYIKSDLYAFFEHITPTLVNGKWTFSLRGIVRPIGNGFAFPANAASPSNRIVSILKRVISKVGSRDQSMSTHPHSSEVGKTAVVEQDLLPS